MSEFNRKSYEAGKKGGSYPISSTPGQPASAKDREAYWQGKAQAQWLKPPPSIASSSFPVSSSSGGFSGGSGGGGGAAAGKGVAGLIFIVIMIAIFASHDSNDKKTDTPSSAQPIQSQDQTTASATDWNTQAKPSPAENSQTVDPLTSGGNEQTTQQQPQTLAATPGGATIAGSAAPVVSADPTPAEAIEPAVPTGVFVAKHEGFGGRWGQLTLSADLIQFDTSTDHYNFPLDAIAGPDKDGFVLKSGKPYHFQIDQRSKQDAILLFSDWFQQAKARANQARTEAQP
jgi:hypothetical protein